MKETNDILSYVNVDYSRFNLDIVEILEKYAYKVVFPLPSLKEFKDRGYITGEQQFKRDEILLTQKTVKSARGATWVAAVGTLLTAISTFKSCIETNEMDINDADIDRLEEMVCVPKHIIVDDIQTIVVDTIKIDGRCEDNPQSINLNVVVVPNQ